MADVFAVFIFVLWFWLLITVASDLFRRHDVSGLGKTLWVILLIVLPYIGVFAYLLTQGRSMAECHYSPSQAHEFLFAQGWDKYHDRFFTKCYVQEGENAYDKALNARQEHVDQSTSS